MKAASLASRMPGWPTARLEDRERKKHGEKGVGGKLGRMAPATFLSFVPLCVCVCVYLYVCVCVYLCVCVYVHVPCTCAHVCMIAVHREGLSVREGVCGIGWGLDREVDPMQT
jgi:hypothetical protein